MIFLYPKNRHLVLHQGPNRQTFVRGGKKDSKNHRNWSSLESFSKIEFASKNCCWFMNLFNISNHISWMHLFDLLQWDANRNLYTCTAEFSWRINCLYPLDRILIVQIFRRIYCFWFVSVIKLRCVPDYCFDFWRQCLNPKLSKCRKAFDCNNSFLSPSMRILKVRELHKLHLMQIQLWLSNSNFSVTTCSFLASTVKRSLYWARWLNESAFICLFVSRSWELQRIKKWRQICYISILELECLRNYEHVLFQQGLNRKLQTCAPEFK